MCIFKKYRIETRRETNGYSSWIYDKDGMLVWHIGIPRISEEDAILDAKKCIKTFPKKMGRDPNY
jgi:hypothetical protein